MGQDLRFALRTLARSRGFATVAVLTLALGIGANTAIFSVVNGVLLRPLPYRDPDRLYDVREMVPKFSFVGRMPVNAWHFVEWRKRAGCFERMSLVSPFSTNLTGEGEPEQLTGARVSPDFFAMLGVQPALGRGFLEEEEQPGHDRIVVLAHSLWQRRLGSDPGVVGRKLVLDGEPYVIAGVLPAWFRPPRGDNLAMARTEVFRPFALNPDQLKAPFGEFNYGMIGRLKPGVAPEKALAEMNVVEAGFTAQTAEKIEMRAVLTPLRDAVVGDSRRGLLVLLAAVGAVLLILCVNLANLLLARNAARSREAAVRSALGAGRGRLLRQLMTESVVLAVAGGVLGTALSFWGVRTLVRTAPIGLPRLQEIRVDGAVLGFALATTVITGLLFGLLPALRLARTQPQEALKSGSHTTTETRAGLRLRGVLVAVEAGLSAVLLIVAGLLLNSFVRLMRTQPGFEVERCLAVDVVLARSGYPKIPDRMRFFRQAAAALEQLPGVTSAGMISRPPLTGQTWVDLIAREGDTRPLLQRPACNMRFVHPGAFRTLGIPLKRGRLFTDADEGRNVAVVAESMAQRIWPGEDPIGKRFTRGGNDLLEVVGVVGDTRTELEKAPVLMAYMPYWFRCDTHGWLLLRTAMDPRGIAGAVRAAIWKIDSGVPVPEMRTMRQVLDDSVGQRRFQMRLVLLFAVTALLLASLGIYGVVSYVVERRRGEIGIRMALGARPADVRRLVLRQGMTPVLAGLLAGLLTALALGRVLRSLLYGVSATDPVTFAVVAGVLAAVAAAACYLPALRATRTDPLRALRYE